MALCAAGPGAVGETNLHPARTVHDGVARLLRKFVPRTPRVELVGLCQARDHRSPKVSRGLAPRQHDPFEERNAPVSQEQVRIDVFTGPEPTALLAGPVGRIERELPRLDLGQAGAAVGAGVGLAEEVRHACTTLRLQDLQGALGGPKRCLHGVGQPLPILLPNDQPVHQDRDVVVFISVERGRVGEIDHLSVDDGPNKPLLSSLLEDIAELALPASNQRRQHLNFGPLVQKQQPLDDLGRRLPKNRPAALSAVRDADASPEEP